MTPLRELMDGHGVSIGEVSRRLGVSRAAVSQWASGRKPVPAVRMIGMAEVFDVDPAAFASMGAVRPQDDWQPTNVFSWILSDQGMLGHVGSDLRSRTAAIGDSLGWNRKETIEFLRGDRRMTEAQAKAFMAAYLPGVNPVVLADCVEQDREPEAEAVAMAVRDIGSYWLRTWDEAEEMLSKFRAQWEASGVPCSGLDDGRPVPDSILLWVAKYR